MASLGSGAMSELLEIQQNMPPTLTVFSLTRVGAVATLVTNELHTLVTGDYGLVAGADLTDYNKKVKLTVVDPVTLTFPIAGSPTTPATGTITVTYAQDAQGGRRAFWRPLATIYGEMIPQHTDERLQREAIQSSVAYRFRVYEREDITAKMRALWTPSWGTRSKTLEIAGRPVPCEDGRTFMYLEMSEAGA